VSLDRCDQCGAAIVPCERCAAPTHDDPEGVAICTACMNALAGGPTAAPVLAEWGSGGVSWKLLGGEAPALAYYSDASGSWRCASDGSVSDGVVITELAKMLVVAFEACDPETIKGARERVALVVASGSIIARLQEAR
jgi:hypothetical protein